VTEIYFKITQRDKQTQTETGSHHTIAPRGMPRRLATFISFHVRYANSWNKYKINVARTIYIFHVRRVAWQTNLALPNQFATTATTGGQPDDWNRPQISCTQMIINSWLKTDLYSTIWCKCITGETVNNKHCMAIMHVNLYYWQLQLRTGGFCWYKFSLPIRPCWWQPAHSD